MQTSPGGYPANPATTSAGNQGSCQVLSAPAPTGGQYYVLRAGSAVPSYAVIALQQHIAGAALPEYAGRGWQSVFGPAGSAVEAEGFLSRECPPQRRLQNPMALR